MQRQGPVAVLDEITRIKRDHVKSIYFAELAKSGTLDLAVKQRMIRQASEEISSDGEKAQLLEELMAHFWSDTGLRESLILSVNTVRSDGEKARLLSHFLEKPDTSTKDLEPILGVIARISSDGEKSRLLQQLSAHYSSADPVRTAFFRALNSIHSDGERRETLSAFLQNKGLSREDLIEVLESVARLSSDGEKASLLVEMTKHYQEDAAVRTAFFKAADTSAIGWRNTAVFCLSWWQGSRPSKRYSPYCNRPKRISSDGEKAELLVAMARECVNNQELLVSFLEVSNSLRSDGEYQKSDFDRLRRHKLLEKSCPTKGELARRLKVQSRTNHPTEGNTSNSKGG